MVNCQIIQNGNVIEKIEQRDGLEFRDNHGAARHNCVNTPVVDATLDEWHYDTFGIMHQHFHGKADNSGFKVTHDVRPALMFTIATSGCGSKSIYHGDSRLQELTWHKGDANLCFISGEGGLQVNLNRHLSLNLMNVVIPQHVIERLITHNAPSLERLSMFADLDNGAHLMVKQNQPVEKAVARAAADISQAHLLGNSAHRYIESKIIDCLSGFLDPDCLTPGGSYFSLLTRDKMHTARHIITTQYRHMPSLHDLASMVGTNECTLKRAFKYEFGTTVFQYLFDYRMNLAVRYLLDTSLPICDIGTLLGYDYQSHFCTAFKRKFGISPLEYRSKR